jgi:hypothetical protein
MLPESDGEEINIHVSSESEVMMITLSPSPSSLNNYKKKI